MISTLERKKDILNLISELDISPTMYQEAVRRYRAVANFLSDCGIDADIYPQGSFAFGTVIRPSSKDPNAAYDLDFVCQLPETRNTIAPSDLRKKIQDALESSGRYGGKLSVYPECFTIEYADRNGIAFQIDIVPAADESAEVKEQLISKSNRCDLIATSIAIPKHNGERNYRWITNNPKGFKCWFDEINKPYLQHNRDERRAEYFSKHRMVFDSVEDIPDALERSALQRVIQILKYHRDNYYLHVTDGDDIKPISAIINTLAARIASAYIPEASTFELLQHVVTELSFYANHQRMDAKSFSIRYDNRSVITHEDGIWRIENPANPGDNLADKWNADSRIPRRFFAWVNTCRIDLVDSLLLPDDKFLTAAENAFGIDAVKKIFGTKYNAIPARTIPVKNAAKPYGGLEC